MRSSFGNKSTALRNLAEAEELIAWCERTQRGGVIFSPERLLAIHEHVPVDYADLKRKLEEVRDEYTREVQGHLPELPTKPRRKQSDNRPRSPSIRGSSA